MFPMYKTIYFIQYLRLPECTRSVILWTYLEYFAKTIYSKIVDELLMSNVRELKIQLKN